MSLINDALKRAEADKARQAHSTAPGPALQPVESKATGTSPILLGGIFLLGIGAIAIAAALWFKSQPSTQQVVQEQQPTPSPESKAAAQPSPQSAPVAPTAQPMQSIPQVAAIPTQPSQTSQLSAPATNLQAKAIASSPPKPATTVAVVPTRTPVASAITNAAAKPIRLQSIFYRLRSPTVIINGKTLGIGDSVDGIKVVSIQRTSVEIVQNGKYRTLTLQD